MVHPGLAKGLIPITISATPFAAVPIKRTKKRPQNKNAKGEGMQLQDVAKNQIDISILHVQPL